MLNLADKHSFWPYCMTIISAKKQKLLETLISLDDYIGLAELLERLGQAYKERSVRRWLQELIAEGLVAKTGQKRGTRYRAIQAEIVPTGFHFSALAQRSLAIINQPLFERDPVTYQYSFLKNYQPNKTFYLSRAQREKLHSINKPEQVETPAGTYARKIYTRLLVDLSYNSSRLEGNTYSLGETQALIMQGIAAIDKLDEEKIMLLNHKEAIRYLVDRASQLRIDYNVICTLHFLLSDDLIQAKYSGKMRDHLIKIGGSVYIPLEEGAQLVNQLNMICDKASQIADSYEQSFFLLAQLAYLQAFSDVNKRTSRLAANIPLIKNNLYPLAFTQVEKDDYIAAMLAIYELNDTSALSELYVASYLYTSKEYQAIAESMDYNEVRVRYRQQRKAVLRYIIENNLQAAAMDHYIEKQAHQVIPAQFVTEFVRLIVEDLANMGSEKIAGMGITQQQLSVWLKEKKKPW